MEIEKCVLVTSVVGFLNIVMYLLYSNGVVLANPVLVDQMRARFPLYSNRNFLSGKNVSLVEYDYLINERTACKDKNVSLVSLITSTNKNFWARGAIRQTWASVTEVDGEGVVTLFLLAKSDDAQMTRSIREESGRYGDIIMFDFQESYLNLTLKTLLGFQWVTEFCDNAAYVLKTDDDVFINYHALVKDLRMRPSKNLAMGQIFSDSSAIRDDLSKWYTSKSDYLNDKYPPFLVGTGYVLSRDIATKVQELAPSFTFLNWEDVVVGMCLQKLGVKLTGDGRFYRFEHYHFQTLEEKCMLRFLFKLHHVYYHRHRFLWSVLSKMLTDTRCVEPKFELEN